MQRMKTHRQIEDEELDEVLQLLDTSIELAERRVLALLELKGLQDAGWNDTNGDELP